MRRFWFPLLFAFSLSLGSLAFAEPEIRIQPFFAPPSDEKLRTWREAVFQGDEIWIFETEKELTDLLYSSDLKKEVFDRLWRLAKGGYSVTDYGRMSPWLKTGEYPPGIVVPRELKEQLPESFLTRVYALLAETKKFPFGIEFEDDARIERLFEDHRVSAADQKVLRKKIRQVGAKRYLFFTPDVGPFLTQTLKDEYIPIPKIAKTPLKDGLRVEIVIHPEDDLHEIAARFAGERDNRAIERLLRAKLRRAGGREIVIPLEQVMHPFIRQSIYNYSDCYGPNCFNSGLNVNRGTKISREYNSGRDIVTRVISEYRLVARNEPLRAGDLMLYVDFNDKPVHVASHVTEDIVFTKNGIDHMNPYIFQKRSVLESIYFGEAAFKLYIFRRPGPGEEPFNPEGRVNKPMEPYLMVRAQPCLAAEYKKFHLP